MIIQQEAFHRMFPHAINPGAWTAALNKFMPDYGIDSFQRVTAFLAQCGHESQGFTRLIENMNYSANGLAATWPDRYAVNPDAKIKAPNALAQSLHRQPERIANNVYADRNGNGNEASGDGWRFRAHGTIGLTFRDNHAAFAEHSGMSVDTVGGYLLTCEGAVYGACWFWETFGCNALADQGNMQKLTKRINGGLKGLKERNELFSLVVRVFRDDGVA